MASVKHILHREEIQGAGVMKENYGPDVPNPKGSFPGSVVNFGCLSLFDLHQAQC
jgi:hypothetical protein